MRAILAMAGFLMLVGCAGGYHVPDSPCASNPGGQACQIERYKNIGA